MTEDWSGPQKVFFFFLVIVCINYSFVVLKDKFSTYKLTFYEGFSGMPTIESIEHTDNSLYTWTSDPQAIYDEFYASVYDQLTNQASRTQAKVQLLRNLWKPKSDELQTWSVLDAGCGTGHAVAEWAKAGVGRVVGLDYCAAMLNNAEKVVIPSKKLTEQELGAIRWRQESLRNPSACSAGEFSHITCFYFSYYYLEDQEEFFRHLNFWCKQGGKMCVEVVNKHKFDPILESASPFVGFSLQKYSPERIRKSKVTFDKFDYEAEFILTDPKAEFYETFRFKNGHVRRQKHILLMPDIEKIVAMAKRAGWTYIGYQDLNPLGFEYGYLITFEK